MLVFALAQGLFWAGVVATFVMGLGTAITVTAIAIITVAAKSLARRVAGSGTGFGMLALRGVEVAAAFLVLLSGWRCSPAIWRASAARVFRANENPPA